MSDESIAAVGANIEANAAMEKETTPERKARAYAEVMERHGIAVSEREITERIRAVTT